MQVYDSLRSPVAWKTNLIAKNYVDNTSNTPQYLVVRTSSLLQVGGGGHIIRAILKTLQGKNSYGGDFNGHKEKGCQEEKETLTGSEQVRTVR